MVEIYQVYFLTQIDFNCSFIFINNTGSKISIFLIIYFYFSKATLLKLQDIIIDNQHGIFFGGDLIFENNTICT